MPARYRVALHGFSAFERATLTYCFKQAAIREPGYVQVEQVAHGDFIVADASHEGVAGGVTHGARIRDTLFVGAKPPAGAIACIHRPLDPERILRALDDMVAQRATERTPGQAPDVVLPLDEHDLRFPLLDASEIVDTTPAAFQHEPVQVRFADTAPPDNLEAKSPPVPEVPPPVPVPEPAPASKPARKTEAERQAAKEAARRKSRAARMAHARVPGAVAEVREVLLLDGKPEPGALAVLLDAFGFRVMRATDIAGAVSVVETTPLAAAFLDCSVRDEVGIDGMSLCHLIKHGLLALAGEVPPVMLISGRSVAAERVRGKLAGCDAFLLHPVTRGDAARALEACNVALPADSRRAPRS